MKITNGAFIYKPWGFEQILEINAKYIIKKILVNSGCRLSKQYHNVKMESILILDSNGIVELEGNSYTKLSSERMPITIMPKEMHRLRCKDKKKFAEFLEVSTPELDDVVRLEDDYGRV